MRPHAGATLKRTTKAQVAFKKIEKQAPPFKGATLKLLKKQWKKPQNRVYTSPIGHLKILKISAPPFKGRRDHF